MWHVRSGAGVDGDDGDSECGAELGGGLGSKRVRCPYHGNGRVRSVEKKDTGGQIKAGREATVEGVLRKEEHAAEGLLAAECRAECLDKQGRSKGALVEREGEVEKHDRLLDVSLAYWKGRKVWRRGRLVGLAAAAAAVAAERG